MILISQPNKTSFWFCSLFFWYVFNSSSSDELGLFQTYFQHLLLPSMKEKPFPVVEIFRLFVEPGGLLADKLKKA